MAKLKLVSKEGGGYEWVAADRHSIVTPPKGITPGEAPAGYVKGPNPSVVASNQFNRAADKAGRSSSDKDAFHELVYDTKKRCSTQQAMKDLSWTDKIVDEAVKEATNG